MRILLVEDEPDIAGFIKEGLEEENFAVDVAHNGRIGCEMALEGIENYDLIILDWMLPGMSGIEICRSVRKQNISIPIIFLTAKDTVDDTVFALEMGANDYMKKPIAFEELVARIKAHTRKKSTESSVYSTGNIVLDSERHLVRVNNEYVALTQKEFALLEYLLQNKGKVCRRNRIIEKIWDIHFDKDDSVIDVFINALRRKLDKKGDTSFVQTVRGVGYRINED